MFGGAERDDGDVAEGIGRALLHHPADELADVDDRGVEVRAGGQVAPQSRLDAARCQTKREVLQVRAGPRGCGCPGVAPNSTSGRGPAPASKVTPSKAERTVRSSSTSSSGLARRTPLGLPWGGSWTGSR